VRGNVRSWSVVVVTRANLVIARVGHLWHIPAAMRALPLLFMLSLALPVHALDAGETCTLGAPLPVKIETRAGTIESLLDKGTVMHVVVKGDTGMSQVEGGEVRGFAVSVDVDAACAGTLQLCALRNDLVVYEQNSSDSASTHVKTGTTMRVLKQGKTWAVVHVGDSYGFARTPELKSACMTSSGAAVTDTPDTDSGIDLERGEGPGLLLTPFTIDPGLPTGRVDAAFNALWAQASFFRPDAGRSTPPSSTKARDVKWKAQVDASVERARAAGFAFVLVGHAAADGTAFSVELALIDVATGKSVKGVRVHPTSSRDDPWAENALAVLLPFMPAAPRSRFPKVVAPLSP
jgi:hypothetical protein